MPFLKAQSYQPPKTGQLAALLSLQLYDTEILMEDNFLLLSHANAAADHFFVQWAAVADHLKIEYHQRLLHNHHTFFCKKGHDEWRVAPMTVALWLDIPHAALCSNAAIAEESQRLFGICCHSVPPSAMIHSRRFPSVAVTWEPFFLTPVKNVARSVALLLHCNSFHKSHSP